MNDLSRAPNAKSPAARAEVERLLRAIAPSSAAEVDPRRFACLGHLTRQWRPANPVQLRRSLAETAEALDEPIRFRLLRTLAILHWEWALAVENRSCYAFASVLWRRLLADEKFWGQFAAEHQVSPRHLEEVRQAVVEEILAHHLNRAKRSLLSSNHAAARFHFTCLANWEQPPPKLAVSCSQPALAAGALAAEFAQRAAKLRSGWVSEVLHRANERLGDGLETLPEGLSRNHAAALQVVADALQAAPTERRLLVFAVKQATDRMYELAVAGELADARRSLPQAVAWATRLAETHLRPGDALHPENRAVCSLLTIACQLAEEPAESLSYLSRRRTWGGAADREEDRTHEARYHFQLGKLALGGLNFAEGERRLKLAIAADSQQSVYREQLAILYVAWAQSLAKRAAVRLANLAVSVGSFLQEAANGGAVLLRQPQQLHELASEKLQMALAAAPSGFRSSLIGQIRPLPEPLELYWITLRGVAFEAIEKKQVKHYPRLAAALEKLPAPAGDARHEEARPLLAVLFHLMQEQACDAGDLDEAIRLARRAAACDPTHPALQATVEQLEHVQAHGGLARWRRVAPEGAKS